MTQYSQKRLAQGFKSVRQAQLDAQLKEQNSNNSQKNKEDQGSQQDLRMYKRETSVSRTTPLGLEIPK